MGVSLSKYCAVGDPRFVERVTTADEVLRGPYIEKRFGAHA